MSLEGPAGAGKTTLVRDYANQFPAFDRDDGTYRPVFFMGTPTPVTVITMCRAMLDSLGEPGASHGSIYSTTYRLTNLMIDCRVELVILDDFHHLVDPERNRVLVLVSDWLKDLIKKTGIPFLVVGIDGTIEQILDLNPQLSRLFAARKRLDPFQCDPSQVRTIQEMSLFVERAEKAIGMLLTKETPRTELLYRLHYATGGIVGNMMNLLRFASLCADDNGNGTMELAYLSWAFEERLAKHMKKSANPFDVPGNERFIPPEAKDDR